VDSFSTEPGPAYGQYCPIARAVEVVGERWSLLILRDLLQGTTRFNDLARGLPGLSRTLLTKRLRQFERAALVERIDGDYVLTEAGLQLEPVVFALGKWGARWAFDEADPNELDAELLVWWIHQRVDISSFPGKRQVFHLSFRDDARQWWIVVESGVPSVCHADPGYDVDVTVSSDVRTLYEVWLGRTPMKDAVASGRLAFLGPPVLTRRMPSVFRLSAAAPWVRSATSQ